MKLGENLHQFVTLIDAQEKKLLERKKQYNLRKRKGKKKTINDDPQLNEFSKLEQFIEENLRKYNLEGRNHDKQLSTINSNPNEDAGSSESDCNSQ